MAERYHNSDMLSYAQRQPAQRQPEAQPLKTQHGWMARANNTGINWLTSPLLAINVPLGCRWCYNTSNLCILYTHVFFLSKNGVCVYGLENIQDLPYDHRLTSTLPLVTIYEVGWVSDVVWDILHYLWGVRYTTIKLLIPEGPWHDTTNAQNSWYCTAKRTTIRWSQYWIYYYTRKQTTTRTAATQNVKNNQTRTSAGRGLTRTQLNQSYHNTHKHKNNY